MHCWHIDYIILAVRWDLIEICMHPKNALFRDCCRLQLGQPVTVDFQNPYCSNLSSSQELRHYLKSRCRPVCWYEFVNHSLQVMVPHYLLRHLKLIWCATVDLVSNIFQYLNHGYSNLGWILKCPRWFCHNKHNVMRTNVLRSTHRAGLHIP